MVRAPSRRRTDVDVRPARLLTWAPRVAIGAGVLEASAVHEDGELTPRLLKLVRMTVSFIASCPYCIGLNSRGWERLMSEDEFDAVRENRELGGVVSLTERERLAIEYARRISATPIDVTPEFGARLTAAFSDREVVVLAATAAQVNYWSRLIQGLGSPPSG